MASQEEKAKGKGVPGEEEDEIESLEKHLEDMKLQGEEEEDLDLSEELDELVKETRWLALFRVHMTKPFSHAALFSVMRNAWAAAKEVTFKARKPNLFVVQFNCLGDWTRVMEGRPWLFRGAAIVMEEYDGISDVKTIKLDRILVWARIHGMPEGLMKKKELAEKIARKVGDLLTVVVTEGKINATSFLRVRVWLDLKKPLVRMVPIMLKERMICPMQYEKIPNFCFFCGFLGHEVAECGDGIHPRESCEWGDWLRVPFNSMIPAREDRGGRGRGRGRGRGGRGGRGAGNEEDLFDMETHAESDEGADQDGDLNMSGTLAIDDGQKVEPSATVSPLAVQEKKRLRTSDQEIPATENTNVRLVLSFEESGRAQ